MKVSRALTVGCGIVKTCEFVTETSNCSIQISSGAWHYENLSADIKTFGLNSSMPGLDS
jgi:hypothetical protein